MGSFSLDDISQVLSGYSLKILRHPETPTTYEDMWIYHDYYMEYPDTVLFICTGSGLPHLCRKMPRHLLCITDCAFPNWFDPDSFSTFATVDSAASFSSIFSCISLTSPSEIDDAKDTLIEYLYHGQSLTRIVQAGSALLGNPITVTDTSFTILAASHEYLYRKTSVQFSKRTYLSNNTVSRIRLSDRTLRANTSHSPLLYTLDNTYADGSPTSAPFFADSFIDCAVRIHGIVVAYLTVAGILHPVSEKDLPLVEFFSMMLSIEFQKSEIFIHKTSQQYESFLLDILEKRVTDKITILTRMHLLNRELDDILRVCTFRKKASEDTPSGSFSDIQSVIRSHFKNCLSVYYQNSIVLLISMKPGSSPLYDRSSLYEFLQGSGLYMGVSNLFQDVSEMSRYYEQSVQAIQLGSAHSRSADMCVYYYKDVCLFHAMKLCSKQINLRDLCHPVILQMYDSNAPADRELLDTLYRYLYYLGDTDLAARALHIHRNTLYYRLGKLKKLFGDDLSTGNGVVSLMFSFKIMEYFSDILPDKDLEPVRSES